MWLYIKNLISNLKMMLKCKNLKSESWSWILDQDLPLRLWLCKPKLKSNVFCSWLTFFDKNPTLDVRKLDYLSSLHIWSLRSPHCCSTCPSIFNFCQCWTASLSFPLVQRNNNTANDTLLVFSQLLLSGRGFQCQNYITIKEDATLNHG